jgi:integral membrane protein (TIGR00529 family)
LLLIWIGFLVSLAGILVISRKNLPLGLISGAVILGLFTLPLGVILDRIVYTITDSSIMLLALAMGVIPIIGGTMKKSGQIDSLVNNVRIRRRYLLPFSAALMGLLPMPGGALLSAPILERGGEGVSNDLKAAINNWFRHLFILVYPLSPALIVSAKICDLDVYVAIVYLLPGLLLASILGYIFFLSRVHGGLSYPERFSWPALTVPLIIILSAPGLDFILKRTLAIGSLATLIGVTTALSLSVILSQKRLDLGKIAVSMKPWNFSLIIIGMFVYLHIFQASGAGSLIATLPLPPLTLSVTAGFVLGLTTGRVQLPASIILPVYLATADHITPFVFALIYIGIYFGYIISPVHPCLVVTCEYFHVSIKDLIGKLALPTLVVFFAVLLISVIIAH